MTNAPLVSIIIPTYNRADKVGTAIDSALGQTYHNIEVIVVDDGSTDETAALMENYPQVTYLIKNHAGQAAARNHGLKNAKGSIIASLDSDDIWNPEFLTKSVRKLELDRLDFVFSNWLQLTEEGVPWDFLDQDPHLQPYFKKTPDNWVNLDYQDLRHIYMNACPSPSSSVVIRKSSIVHGWDEKIRICDDWCMYLDAIMAKECKVAFTLERLWTKRVDSLNIYDGRKRSEILKFLYIEDHVIINNRIKEFLNDKELAILDERYIYSLVELAKHEIFRERNAAESWKLFKTALQVNVPITLRATYHVLLAGFSRKIETVAKKK